jgi:hypothetical protein
MNNNTKFVIYKGTGGLIHMLCGLVHCITWCKKNNHFLIIDVKSHSCYKHYLSDFFVIKDFNNYSEDYSVVNSTYNYHRLPISYIRDYPNIEVDRGNGNFTHSYMINGFNIRCNLDDIGIKEDKIKIYAGPGSNSHIQLINYIKVKSEIIELIKKYDPIDNYIGVHFRNTDIKNDINKIINDILKHSYKTIYLATDDCNAFDIMKSRLPNHNIIQYTKPIDSKGKPIHYINDDKYTLIINILIDIYFLSKSDIFIPSNVSSISHLINRIKETNIQLF